MTTIFDDGAVETLTKALEILRGTQHLIETDGSWAGKQPTKDNVRQYAFALVDEVTEYAKELGWKDWQKPKSVSPARVADEFADVLAFLGILLDYGLKLADLSELEMAVQYKVKTQVNLERLAGKVDGYGALHLHDQLTVPQVVRPADEQLVVRRGLKPFEYYTLRVRGHTGMYLLQGRNHAEGINTFMELGTLNAVYLLDTDDWWEVVNAGPTKA